MIFLLTWKRSHLCVKIYCRCYLISGTDFITVMMRGEVQRVFFFSDKLKEKLQKSQWSRIELLLTIQVIIKVGLGVSILNENAVSWRDIMSCLL